MLSISQRNNKTQKKNRKIAQKFLEYFSTHSNRKEKIKKKKIEKKKN